jgi:S1-C subfamily serine protease
VILDVSGKPLSTPAEVRKALRDGHADGKRTVLRRMRSEEDLQQPDPKNLKAP